MIITVGGSIGSGKSTLAKMLAQRYGLKYYSIGHLMRSLAKERGISLSQLGCLAEKDPAIDKALDRKQKELAGTDCVMDSRLGAYLLPADFKIWLDASPRERARRISGRDEQSVEQAKIAIDEREASEALRYKGIYGIDIYDMSVYNLILDTTNLNRDGMLKRCVEAIDKAGFGIKGKPI